MTVLEAINKGAEFLARKTIESPRLQSELLLAHILNLPRLRLYLEFERALNDAQADEFRELLVRRGNHEPLQHIIGSTSFCGLPMIVTPAVLIPRPETEVLAEQVWTFLNQRENETTFVDLGTGSGCIPIAIAAHAKKSRGVAVDISSDALAVAKQNFEKNGLVDRIELREGDFLAALQPAERFDVIVSNPPYIATAEVELLEPEVRDHDPRLALDGGADGFNFHRALAQGAAQFLKPGGRLFIEFADGQGEALRELFGSHGWHVHGLIRDLSGVDRILFASINASSSTN
ncbi:MAG TPA: peptide chain release factor N(5)-glutamine methyltransferase [Verrucomicrobiae bacterium]